MVCLPPPHPLPCLPPRLLPQVVAVVITVVAAEVVVVTLAVVVVEGAATLVEAALAAGETLEVAAVVAGVVAPQAVTWPCVSHTWLLAMAGVAALVCRDVVEASWVFTNCLYCSAVARPRL